MRRRLGSRRPFDQLDAVVDEVRVEVLDLLFREVDFLQARDDLVVGEKPFFCPSVTSLCSSSMSGSEMSTVSIALPLLLVTSAT